MQAEPSGVAQRRGLLRRRREVSLVAVALLAAGLGLLARDAHLFRRLEQLTIDTRFQVRGPQHSERSAGIVLVLVDDATFDYLRNHGLRSRWPFPRRYHARVIDRLSRAGAQTIAYDVAFESPSNRYDDAKLLGATERAGNVVLSATTVEGRGQTPVLGGNGKAREVGARVGNANLIEDSDGVTRSTYYSVNRLRTFSVVAGEEATGRPVPVSWFGGRSRPVPIDYLGPPGAFRRPCSAASPCAGRRIRPRCC
jgi:adenylate cyclase